MNKEEISEMMEKQMENQRKMMYERWMGLVSKDDYDEMKKKAEELAEEMLG